MSGYEDFDVSNDDAAIMLLSGFATHQGDHLELTPKGKRWMEEWLSKEMPLALIRKNWTSRHANKRMRMTVRGLISLARMQRKLGVGTGSLVSGSPSPPT